MHWRRKWQPTPVFLPGESQGQGSLVGCHLWGHTESDTTEVISSSSSSSTGRNTLEFPVYSSVALPVCKLYEGKDHTFLVYTLGIQ